MKWFALMCKPNESRLARRKLTEAGYQVRALECQGEPLTAYLFVFTDRISGAYSVEGILRVLPDWSCPQALSSDDMAVLDEIERALAEATRHAPPPIDAAKAALANLLRTRGYTVTVKPEPHRHGRTNARRLARMAS